MTRFFAVLLLLAGSAAALPAQTPDVVLRGRGEPRTDARIREILREPAWEVWTTDTLLARSDTVRRPLLVVGATARIDGTVLQDLVIVGGDVFVRPSGRIEGAVRNIAGGWYPSALATIPGPVENEPNAPYDVELVPGGAIITGTTHRRALGFVPVIPTYDRVNGLSLGTGVELLLPTLGRIDPGLRAWGGYRSERGRLDGGAEARVSRGGTALFAGAERTTLNNQAWIRGSLSNSVSYAFNGKDYRDYYEADRAWVELRRLVERGTWTTELRLRAQVEEATSLYADDPWSLFKPDSIRPNGFLDPADPAGGRRSADPGRITSLTPGVRLDWERPTFVTELDASTEFALDLLDSDFVFARYELTGEFAMLALKDHTLEIEAHFRGPLYQPESCADCAYDARIPRQRWSFVGGSGTLYTFETAEFFGDQVAFVETSYAIPLGRRFRLGLLGIPSLELLHNFGMAWLTGRGLERHALEQNVGLRLSYNVAYFRIVSNPESLADDVELAVGITFPKRGYPWQSGGFF